MAKRKVFQDFDPSVPTGPSVADTLRETRQSLGYQLQDVATMLRIRYPYLLAIEEGRFQDLPGTTYAVGFLRSYAEYLGLDPEVIANRYKEEAVGAARKQELYLPTPVPEGRIPGGTVLLGTLVLAGIVYGSWYYLSATDRSMVDLVPALPDRLVSLLDTLPRSGQQVAEAPRGSEAPAGGGSQAVTGAPVPVPPSSPTPSAPAPASTPTASAPAPSQTPPYPVSNVPAPSPVPAAPPTVAALPRPPAPPAAASGPAITNVPPPPAEDEETEGATQEPTPINQAAAPPPPPAPRAADPAQGPTKAYGLQNQSSRLTLRATQESWVQVRDGSEIVFTRVLKPGDTYRVPDKPNVKVRTGNAGGLVVVADGVESPPLGSVGQVLRDVTLDSHGVVRASAR